ncbi:hypothetical protein H8356DRAFT_1404538 [Neocallimastix lanati (nom. inval.)]|nr:hypothetical protein H8356DRAFT_1404538 [Neocallimastix sp. JGI-2020a]
MDSDSSNNKIYFDNIEEYARYIGPNWFGVSYCGNNTIVNNVGEYFKVLENKNYDEQKNLYERDEEKNENENKNKDEEEIRYSGFKCLTFNECRENIKKVYDGFIKEGLKSILFWDKSLFDALKKDNNSDFIDCISVKNKEIAFTCTVSYTDEIQRTMTITNENCNSYHISNGILHGEGDTSTKEISNQIEIARTLSMSNSTNGKSKAMTHNNETTHSDTTENSYSHMINEDHSHAVTKSKDSSSESNWSNSEESTTSKEYSRMRREDFENTRATKYFKDAKVDTKSDLLNAFNYIEGIEVYKYIKDKVDKGINEGVDWAVADVIDDSIDGKLVDELLHARFDNEGVHSGPSSYNKRSTNNENIKHNYMKRDFTGIVEGIVGASNFLATGAGIYLQDQANIVQKKMLEAQIQQSADELNTQIAQAIAGTYTSGSSNIRGSTKGGAKTESEGWSDCITDSSGINKGWTNSTGYSDSYTTVGDTTSIMLTSNFNKDSGWVNEESTSDTNTHGYTYGRSKQVNTNDQITYDQALDQSAQISFTISNTTSTSKVKTTIINVTPKEDKIQKIKALPLFKTEVTVWATGYVTESGKVKIKYNKSLIPISFKGFTHSLEFYSSYPRYDDGLVNPEFSRFVFYREDGKAINILKSGKY